MCVLYTAVFFMSSAEMMYIIFRRRKLSEVKDARVDVSFHMHWEASKVQTNLESSQHLGTRGYN